MAKEKQTSTLWYPSMQEQETIIKDISFGDRPSRKLSNTILQRLEPVLDGASFHKAAQVLDAMERGEEPFTEDNQEEQKQGEEQKQAGDEADINWYPKMNSDNPKANE